jgi:hypothetical protein
MSFGGSCHQQQQQREKVHRDCCVSVLAILVNQDVAQEG